MSAAGQAQNQNEPTGMISSRLNAGFKFVSDSVIDSVSDPAHKLFPRTNRGRLRSPVQPYPLTPPTPPLGAPALAPVCLSPLHTPHSGVSTCGSLATAAVADYQGMVAIRPFAAIHACVTWRVCMVCMHALDHPKIAKAAWLPLSILG